MGALVVSLMVVVGSTVSPSPAVAATDPCKPKPKPTPKPTPTPTPTPLIKTSAKTVAAKDVAAKTATCPIVPWEKGYRPPLGPVFNNPLGNKTAQTRIITRIRKAISATKAGATVQLSSYTYAYPAITRTLLKAKKRGVHIQVVLNGRLLSQDAKNLRRYLGSNPKHKSFLIACKGRCRNPHDRGGNLHSKVVAISKSGGARYYIISMSGNFTIKAVSRQWNESYAVARDKALWKVWTSYFTQMKNQRTTGARVLTYNVYNGSYGARFFKTMAGSAQSDAVYAAPKVTATSGKYKASKDHVIQRFESIGCKAPKGYGVDGHTIIRITMYAWFGQRGLAIAKEIAKKKRQGCKIAFLSSVGGRNSLATLIKAGIPVKSADWEWVERDPAVEDGLGGYGPRFYSHLKYMTVNGTVAGKPQRMVWAGSENWGSGNTAEETIFISRKPSDYRAYYQYWKTMWTSRAVHRNFIYPTYGP